MISCDTCHRGRARPTAPLAFAPIRDSRPVAKAADAPPPANLPTVEQIFDRYENATGGRAAHAKIKTRSLTGVQLSTEGATWPFRLLQHLPGSRHRHPKSTALGATVSCANPQLA